MCTDKSGEECVDICGELCADMRVDTCVDMCVDTWVDMCVDTWVDMCIDMRGAAGCHRSLCAHATMRARASACECLTCLRALADMSEHARACSEGCAGACMGHESLHPVRLTQLSALFVWTCVYNMYIDMCVDMCIEHVYGHVYGHVYRTCAWTCA